MRVLGVILLSIALLAAPALSHVNDADEFGSVVSRIDNKLHSLEEVDNDDDDVDANDNTAAFVAPRSSSKVLADVTQLEESLISSDLPTSVRADIEANLVAMKKDAQEYNTAGSESRREALAEAMQTRMKALRLQIKSDNQVETRNAVPRQSVIEAVQADVAQIRSSLVASDLSRDARVRANHILEEISESVNNGASVSGLASSTSELRKIISGSESRTEVKAAKPASFEEEASNKVINDIFQLESSIDSSDLPQETMALAKANLISILQDTRSIASGVSESRKADLSKAIKLRMEALHLMMAPKSQELEADNVESRVESDISAIRNALPSAHLSHKKQKEVITNLEAIQTDSKELVSATPRRAKALKEALRLRMQALQREVQ